MLGAKLVKAGSIELRNGKIRIEDFEFDCPNGLMCREVATLAMLWAIGELQREVMANIEKPGGSGNTSCD